MKADEKFYNRRQANELLQKGWPYLVLGILAVAGLCLEGLLAFGMEEPLYGAALGEWSDWQNILHWTGTSLLWGVTAWLLILAAKRKCGFDLLEKKERMKPWQWVMTGIIFIILLVVSYADWQGFKILKEFQHNGWLKFLFQYIYYAFETGLFTLVIVFGQKACEKWFHRENFPFGGVFVALTWGLGHILTKGSIMTGLLTAFSGFAFGAVYLLVNRDYRKTYLLSFLMFIM